MKYVLLDISKDLTADIFFEKLTTFLPIHLVGIQASRKEISSMILPENVTSFSRLNLNESSLNENQIKQQISSQRKNFDIICVEPNSASLSAFAARDRRVDIIRVTPSSKLKEFNTRYGRRIDEYGKSTEIDLSFFWEKNFAKLARPVIRILKSWDQCKFPILLTQKVEKLIDIKSYPGMQSLGKILGIPSNRSSSKPLINMISLNRKKLGGIVPIEGVEIEEW